jgi:hypothetical protein
VSGYPAVLGLAGRIEAAQAARPAGDRPLFMDGHWWYIGPDRATFWRVVPDDEAERYRTEVFGVEVE